MGFLDRLAADLIGDATGLPVKGLVRKAGVSKLLLLGGAAVAGGVAVQKLSERRGSSSTTPGPPPPPPARSSAPPPPPPPPPAVPLPPLPGSQPTPTAQADEIGPDLAYAVARTMVAAALADGQLSPQERSSIQGQLTSASLGEAQKSQITADLLTPAEPKTLAALGTNKQERNALYRAAFLVVMADRELVDAERSWLDVFAGALGLSPEQRTTLELDLRAAAGL